MKINIDERNEGVDITAAVNRLINSSSVAATNSDGMTELEVSEQAQVQTLDELVVLLDIDKSICSNYSTLVKNGVSDDYAMNIAGRMLLKAAGSKALNCKREDIDVSDDKLQSFFEEHDLGRFTFDSLMSERAQQMLFGGMQEVVPILRWRWNNELLFLDYKDRVIQWMNVHSKHQVDTEVNEIIGKALAFHQLLNILNNDFKMLCESDVYKMLNPVSQEVFDSVMTSRLTLDREAIRVLSKSDE
jgi:hypothetical protein